MKSGWYPKRQIKILDSIGIRVIIRLNTVTLDTQKSRYLQNLVKDRIIKLYPSLTKKDIRTSTTGENGADVKLLSLQARKLFPYSVECKNRSDNKQIYSFYKQATKHTQLEPLLVIKTLREKPLAIIDLEHLFELQEDTDH